MDHWSLSRKLISTVLGFLLKKGEQKLAHKQTAPPTKSFFSEAWHLLHGETSKLLRTNYLPSDMHTKEWNHSCSRWDSNMFLFLKSKVLSLLSQRGMLAWIFPPRNATSLGSVSNNGLIPHASNQSFLRIFFSHSKEYFRSNLCIVIV